VVESLKPVASDRLHGAFPELRDAGAKPVLATPPMRRTKPLKGLYGKAPYYPDVPMGFSVVLLKCAESRAGDSVTTSVRATGAGSPA
jgi:hypothetical protein